MTKFGRAVLIALALVVALWPLLFLLLASLASGTAFDAGFSGRSVHAYAGVVQESGFARILVLTLLVALGVAVATVLIAAPAGYSFARHTSRLATMSANSLLSAWLLPQILVALAFFNLVAQLNLYGSPGLMLFFGVLQTVPLSVWVLRSSFERIPVEIDEAASLDGAGLLATLRRVVVPVAMPSIAASAGYAFLLAWQMYLYPLVFLAGQKTQMVSVGLVNFVGEWSTNYPEMMAFSVIVTAPVVVVFLLVQRYIVAGLMAGSVVG